MPFFLGLETSSFSIVNSIEGKYIKRLREPSNQMFRFGSHDIFLCFFSSCEVTCLECGGVEEVTKLYSTSRFQLIANTAVLPVINVDCLPVPFFFTPCESRRYYWLSSNLSDRLKVVIISLDGRGRDWVACVVEVLTQRTTAAACSNVYTNSLDGLQG